MTQPTQYYPSYNFTQYQASHPSTPLPAASLDSELFNISASITEICQNLALIQRDDGALANQSVGLLQLGTDAMAFFSAVGRIRGPWLTTTAYIAQDVVTQGSGTYACAVAHTSGTFATDLAAGKWVLIAGSTGTTTYASLSDVLLTSLAANQLMTWNGTKWVNGLLLNANITAGTIAFDRMAAAFSNTSTSLAGATNTNVPTTTAVKTYIDQAVRRGTGTPIASAATLSLTGNTFDYVHVTGAAVVTAVTLAQDEEKEVVFDGACTLTHNGVALILPGAANIVTAANDRALLRGIDGTNVICLWFQRTSGKALIAQTTAVTQSPGDNSTNIATTAYVDSVASSIKTVKRQQFTGSTTYTPSAGLVYCICELVGAGGGGASAGKGGAGGEYRRGLFTAATIGASQAVTIGAGGSAGVSSGDGGLGGDTSLGALLVGKGGTAGTHVSIGGEFFGVAGGSGGSGTGLSISGGDSGHYNGSAGSGAGGWSVWGFGGWPALGGSSVGGTGFGYGSGGGASTSGSGTAGQGGLMYITEFCSQ